MDIVIVKVFYLIIVGLFYALCVCLVYKGFLLVKEQKQNAENGADKSNFNKEQYVKDNREIFGINDNGCSDKKEIYTVSPQMMGF